MVISFTALNNCGAKYQLLPYIIIEFAVIGHQFQLMNITAAVPVCQILYSCVIYLMHFNQYLLTLNILYK